MKIEVILVIMFFIILISIQFTLNLILREVRDMRKIMLKEPAEKA